MDIFKLNTQNTPVPVHSKTPFEQGVGYEVDFEAAFVALANTIEDSKPQAAILVQSPLQVLPISSEIVSNEPVLPELGDNVHHLQAPSSEAAVLVTSSSNPPTARNSKKTAAQNDQVGSFNVPVSNQGGVVSAMKEGLRQSKTTMPLSAEAMTPATANDVSRARVLGGTSLEKHDDSKVSGLGTNALETSKNGVLSSIETDGPELAPGAVDVNRSTWTKPAPDEPPRGPNAVDPVSLPPKFTTLAPQPDDGRASTGVASTAQSAQPMKTESVVSEGQQFGGAVVMDGAKQSPSNGMHVGKGSISSADKPFATHNLDRAFRQLGGDIQFKADEQRSEDRAFEKRDLVRPAAPKDEMATENSLKLFQADAPKVSLLNTTQAHNHPSSIASIPLRDDFKGETLETATSKSKTIDKLEITPPTLQTAQVIASAEEEPKNLANPMELKKLEKADLQVSTAPLPMKTSPVEFSNASSTSTVTVQSSLPVRSVQPAHEALFVKAASPFQINHGHEASYTGTIPMENRSPSVAHNSSWIAGYGGQTKHDSDLSRVEFSAANQSPTITSPNTAVQDASLEITLPEPIDSGSRVFGDSTLRETGAVRMDVPAKAAQASHMPSIIAHQMASEAPKDRVPVEIALDPPELGAVRMTLSTSDVGVPTLTIYAERPEVIELMRRHIAQLADALAAAGHEGVNLEFSQQGQKQSSEDDAVQDGPHIDGTFENNEAIPIIRPVLESEPIIGSGRLNLTL